MAKTRAVQAAKNEIIFNPGEANPKQLQFFQSRTLYTCYGGAKAGGKALANGTPVCTPYGWEAIESLKIGDIVTGSDGKPVKVTGVYPQGVKKTYDIKFRDGFTITASEEHLWKYRVTGKAREVNGKRYARNNWVVGTTLDMLEAMRKLRSNQSIVIPICGAVEWEKKELPIKPYTLGALIGDGSLSCKSVCISTADVEVIDRIHDGGYETSKWQSKYEYGVLGIRGRIVELGLNKDSRSKRIPSIYLNSDIEDRMELLRGLMDTDGYCDTRGHCSYSTVSKGLAEDVQYLIRSLGGIATLSAKNRKSGFSFEVNIRMPGNGNEIFHLQRKLNRLKPYMGGNADIARRVVSITDSGERECTCISVDSKDRLFVADGFTVTHNTWAVRVKAAVGALGNPGIKILIMRCHYPELEMNHIRPLCAMIMPLGCASYNGSTHILTFENGSVIKFGHWAGEESENEYNGQEYDWIFIDEATQFSERAFNFLGGCLRSTNDIPARMYLTCNPGGVGHFWVKRLFIDRDFKTDSENPDDNENPDDYSFIFATVDDNIKLLEASPHYKRTLSQMPNARAYRYGDWDAVDGNYFKEFKQNTHVRKPFKIPKNWTIYRSFDYGLDMLAVMWWAVDEDGRAWCFRSYEHKDLGIQDAAQAIIEHTLPHEKVLITYAPPDMWSRQKDTGRTIADTFLLNGVPIVKADNNRVQGHMVMRYLMSPIPLKDPYVKSLYSGGEIPKELPQIMFFEGVGRVLKDIESIQADEDNPNDCAKQPHEITHTVDAVRYFCINRAIAAEENKPAEIVQEYEEEERQDYEGYMTGGNITESYLSC